MPVALGKGDAAQPDFACNPGLHLIITSVISQKLWKIINPLYCAHPLLFILLIIIPILFFINYSVYSRDYVVYAAGDPVNILLLLVPPLI